MLLRGFSAPPGARTRSRSTAPGRFRGSEGRRPHLLQRAQAAQVVGRSLPVQVQLGPRQPDAAQRLAAHLLQAGEHMLHPGAGLGDAPVASLLAVGERLARLPLALDVQPPALDLQALLARAVHITLVGPDVAAGVARIEHALEVQGVVNACGADVDLADELVTLVHAGGELVAVVALAVLLGPARLHVLLPTLRRRPVGGHRVLLHDLFLLPGQRLLRCRHDAGIDHLPAAGDRALPVELPTHRLEDAPGRPRLDQAFLEGPDRGAVGGLRTLAQHDEALKAQAVEQLELHLLVAQVVELLDHQHAHHQLGGKRRANPARAARSGRRLVDLGRQRRKVHMCSQLGQRVTNPAKLGFALLLGKQTDFDHLYPFSSSHADNIMPGLRGGGEGFLGAQEDA